MRNLRLTRHEGERMSTQFKTVGIYGRVKDPGSEETLRSLIRLLQNLKQEIVVEATTATELNEPTLPAVPKDQLGKRCDLLMVVGGDGSMLHAAHMVVEDNIPMIGINRGRLGFLTDIRPADLTKIHDILNGQYSLEKRFLLSTSIELQGKNLGQGAALNEVALIPDSVPHMTEFEIYIDDQFVCSQDSDGLIIATPTGSTAYALSGGGPILHPQLDAIVIVPMFPHTLSVRPIVIEGNRRVTIAITPNNTTSPRVTCDSQTFMQAPPGSRININKKQKQLQLVHPIDYDYYESLRSKLYWGRKLHYTE